MFKSLVIIRLKSMFAGMLMRGKGKASAGKKALFILLAIYIIACFGGLFGGIFVSICKPFASIGMNWLYFAFMALMVFALCFIGSVFVTQNQLYEASDNDTLLSMPMPIKYILVSRLTALIVLNYVYELLVIIPGIVVYIAIIGEITVVGFLFFLIGFLLLPLIVVTASALFGWIIALANTKMRNKNTIMMVLTLLLFGGYMFVCIQMQKYLQLLIQQGEAIGDAVRRVLPPFYYLGDAIISGNVLSFLIFLACCIIPFAIVYYVLSVSFIKIATTSRGQKKIKYEEKAMKTNSLKTALALKEIRHFTGSPMYMFNAGIGLLFMVAVAIYMFVKREYVTSLTAMFGMDSTAIGPIICAVFATMASMVIISAPSISIEGQTLWIAQSSPILERESLLAKANSHIIVSLPFILVSAALMEIAFDMSLISRIMVILFPITVTIFNALTGVAINLKYPKFDWISEIDVVKQGMATLLAMLVSIATVALPIVLYIAIFDSHLSMEIYLCIVFALFVLGSIMLYRYLTTKGIEIFRTLQG